MVNKIYLTYHLTFISIIFSLYIFEIFFIVSNDPKFFMHSTLYTMLVCICNKFWVFSKFCVPYSIPPVNNLLSCEQMALANQRAEPQVATSLRSFLSGCNELLLGRNAINDTIIQAWVNQLRAFPLVLTFLLVIILVMARTFICLILRSLSEGNINLLCSKLNPILRSISTLLKRRLRGNGKGKEPRRFQITDVAASVTYDAAQFTSSVHA